MRRHESTTYAEPRTPLLTVNDLARLLGISRDSVYRMIRSGELVPYRVGERFRFRPEDVETYLERQREGP
jgi:excisionase family DNA binding protein